MSKGQTLTSLLLYAQRQLTPEEYQRASSARPGAAYLITDALGLWMPRLCAVAGLAAALESMPFSVVSI